MSTPASIENLVHWNVFYTCSNNASCSTESRGSYQLISKESLLEKIEKAKLDYKDSASNYCDTPLNKEGKDFRLLANGVLQAEGHIGGCFPSLGSFQFRPFIYICQNASDESIKFLVTLYYALNQCMEFTISKNKSNIYHIRLQCRDFYQIVNIVIPYFSLTYGDKYKGLKKLEKIYYLKLELKSEGDQARSNLIKAKITYLAYSLVDNSARIITLFQKLGDLRFLEISPNYLNFSDNTNKIQPLFILGFFLGDGNFTVRIRKGINLPWFIPILRIPQKLTDDNIKLLKIISDYFNKHNIKSEIKISNRSVELIISEIKHIKTLVNSTTYKEINNNLFYWKKNQLFLMQRCILIMGVSANNWKKAKLVLLENLYSVIGYQKPIEYWINVLDNYYSNSKYYNPDNFYICNYKDKAWSVTLPIVVKPRIKYFFFKTYMSKDLALIEARSYRDKLLNNWLTSVIVEPRT